MEPHLHHSIVAHAVHELFLHRGDVASQFGLSEAALTGQLMKGQDIPDRHTGPTWLPAWVAPGAQQEHSMARSPNESHDVNDNWKDRVTGDKELARIKAYLTEHTELGRAASAPGIPLSGNGVETEHIGRAIHCIMDSYSGAHTTRDYTNGVKWDAPVMALHVFGWTGGTHDGDLDKGEHDSPGGVLLERASDRAAIDAVFNYLVAYVTDREGNGAAIATTNLIEQAFQGDNVKIFGSDKDKRFNDTRASVYSREVCEE